MCRRPPTHLPKTLRVRSFAKINNGLKILRKRPDGYHELRTIYQTIGLHDRLEIGISKAGEGIKVACDNPAIPSGQGNLVYRTCEAWAQAREWKGRIRVQIAKTIPLGSGLGGASTNAAAILGLERLTGDRLEFSARHKLVAALGSMCRCFFSAAASWAAAEAKRSIPSSIFRPPCLVVFPGFSISTAEAYREAGLRLTEKAGNAYIDSFGAWPHFPLMSWGPAENDFEMSFSRGGLSWRN